MSKLPDILSGPSYNAVHVALPLHRRGWRGLMASLKQLWLSTQVSYRGQYSIERLLTLDEYTRTASWARVLLVCVGTPLPVVFLVLAQESVPLQDPADGWRVNYGIWVRGAIASGVVARTILVQLKHLVDGVTISSRHIGLVVFFVMTAYTALALVLGANVFFPIPFMTITMTLPFLVFVVVSFRLFVGGRVVHEILQYREQLLRFILFLGAQTLMSVTYPAYQVLFQAAKKTEHELFVIALLPVVKLVMRNLIALCFSRMNDMMPEAVIFSVDFFNAFYMATSMQSASSTTTVAIIMAFDVIHTYLVLRGLKKRTITIMRRLGESNSTSSDEPDPSNLLDAACSLCQQSNEFEVDERAKFQLRSCISYRPSAKIRDLLDRLEKCAGYTKPASDGLGFMQCGSRRNTAIQPIQMKKVCRARVDATQTVVSEPPCSVRQSKLLREVLKVLFTSECLVLSDYLEACVPILYANYILVMVHLPSARYHTELTGMTTDNVGGKVQTVFTYAILEFLSFIALVVIMLRSCGMKSLHHLAFVLEAHMPLVQDKLMAWTVLTLGARIVHFGVDFTFRFKWV